VDEGRIQQLMGIYELRKDSPNCARCGRVFRERDKRHVFTRDGVFVLGPVCSRCEGGALEEVSLRKG
jgi:hypothetical protein